MDRPGDRDGEGLSTAEAAAGLRRWGPNELAPPPRFEALRQVLRQLANPLVLILLAASVISAVFGQAVSAVIIALMLILSVGLNFAQAYRSQKAAEHLREQVAQTATVVRDGVAREVPVREVVRGDVMHLRAGDLVPADCRLLSTKDLFVNEAALTGESLAREKHAAALGERSSGEAGDTDIFRGTSVVSGVGVALVVTTGPGTQFGRIAVSLVGRPTETEFERGTRRFGYLILQVVLFLVLFAFLVNALLRRDLLESLLFSVALAVGLTPELLPMIVSVTLASGAVRMARRKVIVKQLAAIGAGGTHAGRHDPGGGAARRAPGPAAPSGGGGGPRVVGPAPRARGGAAQLHRARAAPQRLWHPLRGGRSGQGPRWGGRSRRAHGYPVALKVASPDISHKTEVGGVTLDLRNAQAVREAAAAMCARVAARRPQARIEGVLVQPMVPAGAELLLGLVRDAQFGPLVMVGFGGIYVEVLGDTAARLGPVTADEASVMLDELKMAPVLCGVRGARPVERGALAETIARFSWLGADLPELAEIEINPLMAGPDGAVAVDARARLDP
jgi:hypothetical protein